MNHDLIPSPDLLGYPTTPGLMLLLLSLTLAAHWMFIGGAVGATFVVLLNSLRPKDEIRRAVTRTLLVFLPFMLSMGVTLGIAPLLFVQVLYGNFFYSANVLIAGWWLLVVPLVIANLYLFYYARGKVQNSDGLRPLLPLVMMAVFILLVLTLSSNMTLMQTPAAWTEARTAGPMSLFVDSTVAIRAVFAFLGFLASGGVFVAILGRGGFMHDAAAGTQAIRTGLRVTLVASLLQLGWGVLLTASLPAEQRAALLRGEMPTVLFYVAIATLVLVPILAAWSLARRTWTAICATATTLFLAGTAITFARDGLRQVALAPHFSLSSVAVNPQWGPFVMFLVFLVVGIVAIVALLKLARMRDVA